MIQAKITILMGIQTFDAFINCHFLCQANFYYYFHLIDLITKKGWGEIVKSNGTPKRAIFMESGLYEALEIDLNNKWAIRAHLYSVVFAVGGEG